MHPGRKRIMTDNLEKEIISIISDVSGFDEEEVTPDKNLANDLEIDSIKAIEVTVAIEKKFRISIRDEDIPNIITVQDSIDLAKRIIGNI
jgi:acyl carrier protein